MGIVDPKYRRLSPDVSFLSDEAVLVQAWKKCDTYIRQHNWYADILDLDHTSLLIPLLIKKWCEEIEDGNASPKESLRVVWAPKNSKWIFKDPDKGKLWGPSDSEEPLSLRPLAHTSIREQTLAVAAMMCLADAVETVQGNTDQPSFKAAQENSVFSYGNRLFCDWFDKVGGKQQARFRWGNSTTYSQFFQDYERFLYRPVQACQASLSRLSGERLYVVKLDLSKFYDNIDRSHLIERLEAIYTKYRDDFDAKHLDDANTDDKINDFFEVLEQISDWQWAEADLDSDKGKDLPEGALPQGLVASGFFANAYMHEFDQTIGDLIKEEETDSDERTVRLIDYCRYVDDMRVVVAASKDLGINDVRNDVIELFRDQLKDCFKGAKKLSFNGNKTDVIPWEDFAVQGSTSGFMRGIQNQISQSPDPVTLANATGNLDHLLWLAETIDENKVEKSPLALANIANPKVDVRDDTIQRFAANRLKTVLKLRRSMADPIILERDGVSLQSVSERQALDHEIETIARKLVACWAKNPALTRVLRCGLDLFPSPELLRPVVEALEVKLENIDSDHSKNEYLVALYVISEILKAGVVETGFDREECYPDNSDIEGYRNELTRLAIRIVGENDLPWFVYQQASLFLATRKYPVENFKESKLIKYNALHNALKYEKAGRKNIENNFSSGLIAHSLTGKTSHFSTWLCEWLNRLDRISALKLVDLIALCDPSTLINVCGKWKHNPRKSWFRHAKKTYLNGTTKSKKIRRLSSWGDLELFLSTIVKHPENPFVQEIALLKLAENLLSLDKFHLDSSLSLSSITIHCKDWSTIQNPDTSISVNLHKTKTKMPWSETPEWCVDGVEWAYHLGRLLRSAVIGEDDFTTRFYPVRDVEYNSYRGFKTNWFKRRVGLMPLSEGLGEEPTPISPWLNELIMGLLQWPGLEINGNECIDFSWIKEPIDLLELIKKRKTVLSDYFGNMSNLPVYLLPVNVQEGCDFSKFKVAIVQSMMPMAKDICSHDPTFWKPEYRTQHRAHVASMCRLLTQTLYAKGIASLNNHTNVDLIVFPELAIHPDDMWLLRRLSDQTKATIFAGQTFVKHEYIQKPINRAVWLLRQENKSGRRLIQIYQGKQHGTKWELKSGVAGHRPFQVVVEFKNIDGSSVKLSGTICYDSTDLKLAADLRDVSDGLVISALNKDIHTFDIMVRALQYHMYQTVILANTGEFGGSTAQAPYKENYDRLIAHNHGKDQATVSLFEVDLVAFKDNKNLKIPKERKTAPAGYKGRKL